MAEKIKLLTYQPALKGQIIDLLDSKPFKQEIWDWQFLENPCVASFDPVILADKWDTVIGFNGSMPVRMKIDDQIVSGLWSCDFAVDSRYHGKGYGRTIKESLHTRSPLIMALGISHMAAPVLLRMGWKKNNIVDSYRKLNRISRTKSILIKLVQYLNRMGAGGKRRLSGHWQTDISAKLPDATELNSLWAAVSPGYRMIAVRDHAYLYWRYEKHPLATYTFICARDQSGLAAILIVRVTNTVAHVVDYLGPFADYGLKAALLDRFMTLTTRQDYLTCITSDDEWKQLLLDSGFYKQNGKPRFYIHSGRGIDVETFSKWFIMAGDSDGDMLRASEEGPFRDTREYSRANSDEFSVRQLNEEWFLGSQKEWQQLLAESDADPLFMGWLWQTCWWNQWATKYDYQLHLLGLYDTDGQLVGLAPLYRVTKRLNMLFHYKQLLFIGSSWGGVSTVRSEYLDFIVHRGRRDRARHAFLDYLSRDRSWDQMIFSDINRRSPTLKLLDSAKYFDKEFLRTVQSDIGIIIDVSKSFSAYMESLSQGARRCAYNQRKLLEAQGKVEIKLADTFSVDTYLDRLNQLNALRWGVPCFDEKSLLFHKHLARSLATDRCLKLSMILVSKKPVSVLYDIVINGRAYNIQAGFDDNFNKQLTMGFLHLGYSIQDAFNSPEIKEYDLLAGPGKKTFYKKKLGSKKVEFISLQYNRKYWLRWSYVFYDYLPDYIKLKIRHGIRVSR